MGKWIQLSGRALYVDNLSKEWVVIDGITIFATLLNKKKTYTIGGKKVVGWYTRGGKRIPIFAGDKKGGGIGGGWKPFGTKAEAEEFAKDSKFTDDVFHGTASSNTKPIMANGFKAGGGDAYGKAIYFTNKKNGAIDYGKSSAQGSEYSVLVGKVNIKKPFVTTPNNWIKASEKYGKTKADFYKFVKEVRKDHDSIVVNTIAGKFVTIFDKKKVMLYNSLIKPNYDL